MSDDLECVMILHRVNLYFFRVSLDEMSLAFKELGGKIKNTNWESDLE